MESRSSPRGGNVVAPARRGEREPQDIFLRVHTARTRQRQRSRPPQGPKWPSGVLIFDTETTTDTQQVLNLGAYRRCQLVGETYQCVEEGLFHSDEVTDRERQILNGYVQRRHANTEVKTFPPKLRLSLHSRSAFVEQVFWKAIRNGDLVVAFNLPFDLSRLAVDWRRAKDEGWSLILSQQRSRKSGRLELNLHRPRIRVTARNSQSAFIRLMRPMEPEEWPREGRFLDLRTFARALYDKSYSLDRLCRDLKIKGKVKHEPTGRVTVKELDYCREDVRATMDALNKTKEEFDRHPIGLRPDEAYSPASIAKAYLDAMGVIPPLKKFRVSNTLLGIAMQSYFGGRCEMRIRRFEAPVIHTDFASNYATGNALLGNWDVLTAKRVTFEEVTHEIRSWLATITLDEMFRPEVWRKLSFFARVRPERSLCPVRTVYNGETTNIGLNYLTSDEPIWMAGPDIVVSMLLTGKAPRIEKAIRMVPHGKQKGLAPITLRGLTGIDPRQDDFFRRVVEQRHRHKKNNKPLAAFLKTVGNAGSYGIFVEVNSKTHPKRHPLTVFAGETRMANVMSQVVEEPGRWYFPPIAALITASSRLLLAMLERCVSDAGGTYLFTDTDSLCIVAGARERWIPCPGGTHRWRGRAAIKALSYAQVRAIADRFVALNPYDRALVPPSILKIEDINFKAGKRPRYLLGFGVSAKRYVLYSRAGSRITLVDPKAHGLGYLYPPVERRTDGPPWTFEAWNWMLRNALGLPCSAPKWLTLPTMMRVTLSTPFVLDRLNRQARPFNFMFGIPIDSRVGYPAGVVDRQHFTLIAPFTKRRDDWLRSPCINVHDGRSYRLALRQTAKLDRVIPRTFASILRLHLAHVEAKSHAPDGTPCTPDTAGLLQRASVTAAEHRPILKETDRKFERGEDLGVLGFKITELRPALVAADESLRARMRACGMRPLMRKTGLSQHTLEKILTGRPVRRATLHRVIAAIGSVKTEKSQTERFILSPDL